jgi:hypothetical protein
VIAVIVSVAARITSWRTQKWQVAIEQARERDRLKQTRKALLVAKIIREPGRNDSTDWYLEIENRGAAAAGDIAIMLDGASLGQHRAVLRRKEEVRHVGALWSFRYRLCLSSSARLPQHIGITWADGSGERGDYEFTLT